jgi:hypothetical protein
VIRGAVHDRPWGKTLGTFARRGVTGQLTLQNRNARFSIVFEYGHVVAARSPGSAESAITLALRQDLITTSQVPEKLPSEEAELAVLADLLPPDQVTRLRRQSIAACVARTFVMALGEWTFGSEVTLPVAANTATHIGGLIYHGARMHLSERRLEAGVRDLGSRFELRSDGHETLRYFAFGEPERPVVQSLSDGMAVSVSTLDAIPEESERRIARAAVYALASCGVLHCEPPRSSGRFARGTSPPLNG